MLMSMTGFASINTTIPLSGGGTLTISVSIKSLNSRFFETSFKLPYFISSLETDLMQLAKNSLKRGHIFISISISSAHLAKGAVEPAMDVIKSYLGAIEQIQEKLHVTGALSISDLVQLPDVFVVAEKNIDEEIKNNILSLSKKVLDDLIKARTKEGAMIQADLEQRVSVIKKEITQIETLAEALMVSRKQEVSKQVHELGTGTNETTESARMLLYNELNKIDIHEEIVRFTSHLSNLKNLIVSTELEKGKRIDFTIQELAREINTIAAKCSDVAIGSLAISIKVELEKIREQAQNVV